MLSSKILAGLLVLISLASAALLQGGLTGYYLLITGANSNLEMWSSADTQGGSVVPFIGENAVFYTNFTDSSTGAPVTGGGVYCNIMFNVSGTWSSPVAMSYNGTSQLYEYSRSFTNIGNYTWNALCNGSSSGYDSDINGTDNVKIYRYEWWNNTWAYRIKIEVANADINVTNWPVEREINFTDVLLQVSGNGTFDNSSTRLYEYNDTGGVMHEIPSQFDEDLYSYNALANALGTFIFIMNGTTQVSERRTFFLYFDVEENGPKQDPSYATNLSYAFSGDELNVNNTRMEYTIDTNRSENTSGLYISRLRNVGGPPIFVSATENDRTIEYMEYSNGTHNFSFDLRDNITIITGPVRITVIQEGDEIIFGNTSLATNEGYMTKKYYIYNSAGPEEFGSFIKIEQNFTNLAGYSIDRNSTDAGSITFDVEEGLSPVGSTPPYQYLYNSTDPYSWAYAFHPTGNEILAAINMNESTQEFYVKNSSGLNRVGVHLPTLSIASGQSIVESMLFYTGRGGTTEFVDIKNAIKSDMIITSDYYEPRTLVSYTETEFDYYNRNETVLITVNVTYDPYDLVSYVNSTLDNSTAGTSDDIVIMMYDDGTHGDQTAGDDVYTNTYNVTVYENYGLWRATATFYDSDTNFLNSSYKDFTVTKTFFVDTVVINPLGDVGRLVNATVDVMNYRQDVWHPGANVTCAVYQTVTKLFDVDEENITDHNNGSYRLNFTAPAMFGLFTLNCSAEKDGNDGYDEYDFSAEEVDTDVQIVVSPLNYTVTNVTWFDNESFTVTVNATNTANGTAYNATIGIELPVNITSNGTSLMCDDGEGGNTIPITKTCTVDFNLTVLETTAPTNFTINVTVDWDNKDTSHEQNQTHMNASVGPTYILDVLENNITSFVSSGNLKNIGNITVRSIGNAPLQEANFTVTGFASEFNFTAVPSDYPTISPGVNENVGLYLLVDDGYSTGNYSGTLNVTSINDGYEELLVNITVSGTNMTLNTTPTNFTADNVTYYSSQSFSLDFNVTNEGNVTAYSNNVTIEFSDALISTTNATSYSCGDMDPDESCDGIFNVVVSNGTSPGNYTVNVSTLWFNPEIGIWHENSTTNVTVLSNVNLTIPENDLTGSLVHGTSGFIVDFRMNSTGNDNVTNVTVIIDDEIGNFQYFNLAAVPNVTQTQGGTVYAGQFITVNITGSIPLSYPNGTYQGFVNVTTNNSGYKVIPFNVTVPESRTWIFSPPSCEHPESPDYGIACNITVNNTGNVNISFNITPAATNTSENNHTWLSTYVFLLENQTGTHFSVYYNVTDDLLVFYNASYNITAYLGEPQSANFSVLLTPFIVPLIEINITPQHFSQTNSTEILVYVTDQAGIAGINRTVINVTRPGGTVDQIQMRRVGAATDPYVYQEFYPDDPIDGLWGNTAEDGNYTIIVYAEDNFGLNDTLNSSFYVYKRLYVSVSTSRANGQYYQGEMGTLVYSVLDAQGEGVQGASVNITITDPTNRSVNMENENFVTNSLGEPSSYPYFTLFSDSPTGTYDITAQSSYNDTPVSQIVTNTSVVSFSVLETRPGMLTLDLEAPAETSTTDGLEVTAIITDGVTNIDPDNIVVSLYDSLDNAILENQSMTQLSLGRYQRYYNTSTSSNQGNWRWVVTVTKDSNTITKDVYTRLIGGPFDVRDIVILDSSIPILGISVVIENTGDDSQDAFIQWNLTRTDTSESLDEGLDTVLIPANSEVTHVVNPDNISYIGDVRITIVVTYSGTEKAAAYDEFTTTEEEPPRPPDTGGGKGKGDAAGPAGPAGPVGVPGIEIIEYPDEIPTETGWSQYPSVTINNSGTTVLRDIELKLSGIPDSWYNITPIIIPLLNPGETMTFVLNLLVPTGTEARQYYGTFNVTSGGVYDEKLTSVIVFGSREELVRYQLEKLKKAFAEFEDDVNATAEIGEKDLSRVYDIMEEIQYQIDLTEGYLSARLFEEALNSVTTGWRLLDRARELLRDAPPLKPMTILEIPDWMLTLILILIIASLALVIVANHYRKRLERIFKFRQKGPQTTTAKDIIGLGADLGGASDETMAATRKLEERKKIEKVLGLLEREYKEGIISERAYNELRKRNMEKLKQMGGEAQ